MLKSMKVKIVLIVVIILAIVGGCAFYFANKNNSKETAFPAKITSYSVREIKDQDLEYLKTGETNAFKLSSVKNADEIIKNKDQYEVLRYIIEFNANSNKFYENQQVFVGFRFKMSDALNKITGAYESDFIFPETYSKGKTYNSGFLSFIKKGALTDDQLKSAIDQSKLEVELKPDENGEANES